MRQTKGRVKVGTGGEQAVVSPDDGVVGLHELGASLGDGRATRDHPGHNAHASREDDDTLGHHLPQDAGEGTILQRHDEGHLDDAGGVGVVNHAVGAIGTGGGDAVVHVVALELTGWTGAVGKAPHNAEGVTGLVDLDDADVGVRILKNIAHVLARAGAHKVLASKILAAHAHLDPLAGLLKERLGLGDLLVGHTVGEVAAVALVPALLKAVIAQATEALDKRQIFHCHCLSPLRDPRVQLKTW